MEAGRAVVPASRRGGLVGFASRMKPDPVSGPISGQTSPAAAALARLVVVLGPTASGKSELALAVAERFGGEIVNFDSVQIRRGFDIGSAKLPAGRRRGIPHHMIDIAEPGEVFSAGDYARLGRQALRTIRDRGKLPVAVGGTGFYLRALIAGLFPGPGRCQPLRERLGAGAASHRPGYLHRLLRRLDPVSAGRIHPNDTPKLIRAIELRLLEGSPLPALWAAGRDPLSGFEVIRLGLDPPRPELYARINRRSKEMFARGLAGEVKELLASGVGREAPAFQSLGYSQALDQLDGKLSPQAAVELTAKQTRRYAKRQMTWFRREPDVEWLRGFGDDPALRGEALEYLRQRIEP